MQIQFSNNKNDTFLLGTVSFSFPYENNVFDKYQEDNNESSNTIFLCTNKENVINLSNDIQTLIENKTELRTDIANKLNNFVVFLRESNYISCVIL